jgi:hypothetical protein
VTISLRALNDDDLNDVFQWESDSAAASMAAFTRPNPTDRTAFDVHYQRVRSDPENFTRAIVEDGALVGMIASFTMEGDREVTYWVDPSRWERRRLWGCATLHPGRACTAALRASCGAQPWLKEGARTERIREDR